jgi:hypothetical protein
LILHGPNASKSHATISKGVPPSPNIKSPGKIIDPFNLKTSPLLGTCAINCV